VVAFLDDDAAPEPTWLRRLVAPSKTAEVAAAGGFVRGRNGISFQWRARQVDGCAREEPLNIGQTQIFEQAPGRAIKTEGTNMAFRRDVLAAVGGFDPQFRFYLDETDLNLRLAGLGHGAALVPGAEVHHAYAASARRKADRAVTDLSEIGASIAYFLRKHCHGDADAGRLEVLMREQQLRVMDQVRRGLLQRRDVGPLMKGLNAGVEEGRARKSAEQTPIAVADKGGFLRFVPRRHSGAVLAGRIWQAARLRAEARERAEAGETVSLFLFGPSPRKHHVRFDAAGYWEQNGGLFGRAERTEPVLRFTSFAARLSRECARVAGQRGLKTPEHTLTPH
jgi:hypothetical protein